MAQGLAACDTFHGFRYFAGSKYLQEFLSLIGKLRYQQRWAKAVRMPETLLWGICLSLRFCRTLCRLNLTILAENVLKTTSFRDFFHDLPEVLTRDIVSPVKNSVKGFGQHNQ